MSAWEEAMWAELEAQPVPQQIVMAGELIELMQQGLVPKLGQLRREAVLRLLNEPGMDATRLAEQIGSRRTTIMRLAEEGRALRREERIRESL